jgi:hypothetical protein
MSVDSRIEAAMIAEPIKTDTEAPQFPEVTGRCPWYSCLFGVWKTLSFALTAYFGRDHACLEKHLADFLSAALGTGAICPNDKPTASVPK